MPRAHPRYPERRVARRRARRAHGRRTGPMERFYFCQLPRPPRGPSDPAQAVPHSGVIPPRALNASRRATTPSTLPTPRPSFGSRRPRPTAPRDLPGLSDLGRCAASPATTSTPSGPNLAPFGSDHLARGRDELFGPVSDRLVGRRAALPGLPDLAGCTPGPGPTSTSSSRDLALRRTDRPARRRRSPPLRASDRLVDRPEALARRSDLGGCASRPETTPSCSGFDLEPRRQPSTRARPRRRVSERLAAPRSAATAATAAPTAPTISGPAQPARRGQGTPLARPGPGAAPESRTRRPRAPGRRVPARAV